MSNDITTNEGEQYEHLRIKIISALQSEGNISRACKAIALSRSTFYLWMKDEEFAAKANESLTLARESRIDLLEDAIMTQALGDPEQGIKANPISQIFALKALTRQQAQSGKGSDRLWSDAPPPELKGPTEEDPDSLTDTNQDKLKAMMNEYILELKQPTKEDDK